MVFAFQSLISNSCRSRSRSMRWNRMMDGPAAVPGDQASDLVLPDSGRDVNPRPGGCEDSMPFCLSLGGNACGAGETCWFRPAFAIALDCAAMSAGDSAW